MQKPSVNMCLILLIFFHLSIHGLAIHPAQQSFTRTKFRVVTSELLKENCIDDQFRYSSRKGCRCYLFQSERLSQGSFKSPNHPHQYPPDLGCIIYSFVGEPNEIVEITFNTFDMTSGVINKCTDYVRLFLNMERAELNESDQPDYELCGAVLDLPQKTFYSRGRVLLMELSTSRKAGNIYQAFTGNFRFLNKDNFTNDGEADIGTECNRVFRSTPPNSRVKHKSGRFFSPDYPQNYPPGISCFYKFLGQQGERIMVTFRNILLEGYRDQCDPRSEGDVIVVIEGQYQRGAKLARLCGLSNTVQVVSDGPQLLIVFKSDTNGVQAKGFDAIYQFVARNSVQATPYLEDDVRGDGTPQGWDVTGQSPTQQISKEFQSKYSGSGTFESQDYPKSYPTKLQMTYYFIGKSSEVVQIDFTEFQLSSYSSTLKSCMATTSDKLEIFDGPGSDSPLIGCLSGKDSKSFRSTGARLTLRMTTDSNTTPQERGFRGTYRFERRISDTNLVPIPVDKYKENVVKEGEKCHYIVESKGAHLEGSIIPPIFPEGHSGPTSCSWAIHGTNQQRIRLRFLKLNLPNSNAPWSGNGYSQSPKVCKGNDQLEVYTYRINLIGGGRERNDVIRFCGQEDIYSVMSSDVPQMDVLIKSSPVSQRYSGGLTALGSSSLHLSYEFVTDFGVTAPFGKQNRKGDCRFEFRGTESYTGNFSSPNYPGLYPLEVTCHYIFIGKMGQGVFIQFIDFDVENLDIDCTDSTGDYLEARGCINSNMGVQKKRLCKSQTKPFKVDGHEPCLHITFKSNDRFLARGFIGRYDFRDLKSPYRNRENGGSRILYAPSISILCVFLVTLTISLTSGTSSHPLSTRTFRDLLINMSRPTLSTLSRNQSTLPIHSSRHVSIVKKMHVQS